jgi:hypothetical protein
MNQVFAYLFKPTTLEQSAIKLSMQPPRASKVLKKHYCRVTLLLKLLRQHDILAETRASKRVSMFINKNILKF